MMSLLLNPLMRLTPLSPPFTLEDFRGMSITNGSNQNLKSVEKSYQLESSPIERHKSQEVSVTLNSLKLNQLKKL